MRTWLSAIKRTWVSISVLLVCVSVADAIQLVTEKEASLPDDFYGDFRGSPTPGPEVEVVSPSLSGLISSPFHFKVRFKAHGGATIDRDSITITYRKMPAIDVTQRLGLFVRADETDVADAELPAGTHRFRIDVKDNRGRWGSPYFFRIGVAK
jgi:hypothetical protein